MSLRLQDFLAFNVSDVFNSRQSGKHHYHFLMGSTHGDLHPSRKLGEHSMWPCVNTFDCIIPLLLDTL